MKKKLSKRQRQCLEKLSLQEWRQERKLSQSLIKMINKCDNHCYFPDDNTISKMRETATE